MVPEKYLFSQDWNIKPHRGRHRKVWSRKIDDLFVSLEFDKAEWLKDIMDGSSYLKAFLALAGESRGKVIKNVSCVVMSVRVSVMCCGSVAVYRADFLLKLQEKLGNGFERFDALDSLGKSSFILGSELWEEHFDSLLPLVNDYVVNIWEARKLMVMTYPSLSPQPARGSGGIYWD